MKVGKVKNLIPICILKILSLLPINKRKIIFKANRGNKYNCNPRAIYEEMKSQRPDLVYIWVMKDGTKRIPGAKVIRNGSLQELYHLATSKIWVDNKRKGLWIRKRKGQYYVQSWHGNIAMKKIEKDAIDNGSLDKYYMKVAKHDSQIADLFIAGSEWQENHYRKSFWYSGEILRTGLPRSDIFYCASEMYKQQVCDYYHMDPESHIVLYAPTFRKNGNTNCYDVDYEFLLRKLENKFGGEWKAIVRLHPNIINKQGFMNYNECVLNGSEYEEINELIMACDLLISDYSSCMFDAIEANKKVIIFASDINEYNNDRGMYFSFDDLPFVLARNNHELGQCIQDFDEFQYEKRIESFKKELKIYNNINGSRQAVNYIFHKNGIPSTFGEEIQ